MSPAWLDSLTSWQPYVASEQRTMGPRLLRGSLNIAEELPDTGSFADTFFDYDCELCQVKTNSPVSVAEESLYETVCTTPK